MAGRKRGAEAPAGGTAGRGMAAGASDSASVSGSSGSISAGGAQPRPHRTARKVIRGVNRVITFLETLVLAALLIFGIYAIWDNNQIDHENTADQYEMYRPDAKDTRTYDDFRKTNPDVCGWLTIDDTGIDYPLVQGEDNDEYMNTTPDLKFALSGSIFLDYRNHNDFSDFNTIIYGHHMEGPSMFGVLDQYENESYFNSHRSGELFYNGAWHELNLFAFLEADAYDETIYGISTENETDGSTAYLNYIREHAKQYSDIGAGTGDHLVVLSTCMTDQTNGRYIVIGRIGNVTTLTDGDTADAAAGTSGELDPEARRKQNILAAVAAGAVILFLIVLIDDIRHRKKLREKRKEAERKMQAEEAGVSANDRANGPGKKGPGAEKMKAKGSGTEKTAELSAGIRAGAGSMQNEAGSGAASAVPQSDTGTGAASGAAQVAVSGAETEAGAQETLATSANSGMDAGTAKVTKVHAGTAAGATSGAAQTEASGAETEAGAQALPADEKQQTGTAGQDSAQSDQPGKKKKSGKPKKKATLLDDIINLVIRIAVIAAVIWIVFTFIFGLFINSGVAMEPSVQDRDIVLFYRLDREYTANEAVVYEGGGEERLGRIVARGGDTVEITDEGLKVNGYLQQDYKNTGETLAVQGGTTYPVTLASDEFFILGDNREESTDSRMFGPVKASDIKGSVQTVLRRRDV